VLRPRGRRRVRQQPATPQGTLTEGTSVNYQKLQELDRGTFGQLWKVLDIDRNELVAVKESQHIETAAVEAAAMRMVGEHRNVVHLIEAFQQKIENVSWLVLPLAENTLSNVMKGPLTKWDFCSFTKQIAGGVEHIHSKGLVHCDIKPVNILTYPGQGDELRFNLKIGDVGSARYEGSSFSEHYLCTRWYRAPEILLGAQSARKPWDIWSVGVILQELLYRQGPLLQGSNGVDQLKYIFAMNGPCSKEEFNAMVNDGATAHVDMFEMPQWSAEDKAEYQVQLIDMRRSLCPNGEKVARGCLKYAPKARCSARVLKEGIKILQEALTRKDL
jgi:serine/threonine protein kinase